MKLKEKFEVEIMDLPIMSYVVDDITNNLECIAEDFAIGFAEWLLWQDITQRGKNNFICKDGIQRNTKQLLEIYKDEQIRKG